eukprot:6175783-Pleurochrysis_carterae.AAC.2
MGRSFDSNNMRRSETGSPTKWKGLGRIFQKNKAQSDSGGVPSPSMSGRRRWRGSAKLAFSLGDTVTSVSISQVPQLEKNKSARNVPLAQSVSRSCGVQGATARGGEGWGGDRRLLRCGLCKQSATVLRIGRTAQCLRRARPTRQSQSTQPPVRPM